MRKKNFAGLCLVLLAAVIVLAQGCARKGENAGNVSVRPYVVEGNVVRVEKGPVIVVEDSFIYAGAESVPSSLGQLKRQIFTGKNGESLTVTVFDASSDFVRKSVSDSTPSKWEYRIREVEGPQWIRITGNITPCCVNLLRSEYLFMPQGGEWKPCASLPEGDVPGRVVLVSFGSPIPEEMAPATWGRADVLAEGSALQLNYEDEDGGLLIPDPGADRVEYLRKQEERAARAYRVQ